MPWQKEKLLILAKTYPNPSAQYRETTCVAALTETGEMRRIFPVPFRLMGNDAQFKKYEWIWGNVIKAANDHRPESHKIAFDNIQSTGEVISTKNGWQERLTWLQPHIVGSFSELESRRQQSGQTLGIIRVTELLELTITPAVAPDWTETEKLRLTQQGLFDAEEVRNRVPLRKVPFNFHYRYKCEGINGIEEVKHMIVDWEAYQLYWNCVHRYGPDWEAKFREKLEDDFKSKDLMLLMGTVHRFPDQWLIISLIYPPKAKDSSSESGGSSPLQPTLF